MHVLPEEMPDELIEESAEEFPPDQTADAMPIDEDDEEDDRPPLKLDPAFFYIILIVITLLGFSGFAPTLRYTIMWTVLAILGITAILLDEVSIPRPKLRDLLVGIVYGALIGVPMFGIGLSQLNRITTSAFGNSDPAVVFQMVIFTMPFAETVFFRGAFQSGRGLIFTVVASSLLSIIMFFPHMNLLAFPLVAAIIGIFFVFVNFAYSYLAGRFNLFTAWTCQITINLLLLFAPLFIK